MIKEDEFVANDCFGELQEGNLPMFMKDESMMATQDTGIIFLERAVYLKLLKKAKVK